MNKYDEKFYWMKMPRHTRYIQMHILHAALQLHSLVVLQLCYKVWQAMKNTH